MAATLDRRFSPWRYRRRDGHRSRVTVSLVGSGDGGGLALPAGPRYGAGSTPGVSP
jgi:hypothetical protein